MQWYRHVQVQGMATVDFPIIPLEPLHRRVDLVDDAL